MAPVIELCRTCGFDVPADADRCPSCRRATRPPLAARQVAGLALPTRSVHELPHLRPRKEPDEAPLPPASAARSAFSFTTVLALITLAAGALAWLAAQPRFVLQVPDGTESLLDSITRTAALASVSALIVGMVAMVAWCLRATGRLARRSLHRHLA